MQTKAKLIILSPKVERSWVCPVHRCIWGGCWCKLPAWHPSNDIERQARRRMRDEARLTVERWGSKSR